MSNSFSTLMMLPAFQCDWGCQCLFKCDAISSQTHQLNCFLPTTCCVLGKSIRINFKECSCDWSQEVLVSGTLWTRYISNQHGFDSRQRQDSKAKAFGVKASSCSFRQACWSKLTARKMFKPAEKSWSKVCSNWQFLVVASKTFSQFSAVASQEQFGSNLKIVKTVLEFR